jgi:hypothetical protein
MVIKPLIIAKVDFIHVEIVELLLHQVIDDFLVISPTTLPHLGHGAVRVKQDHQQFLPILCRLRM